MSNKHPLVLLRNLKLKIFAKFALAALICNQQKLISTMLPMEIPPIPLGVVTVLGAKATR